MPRTPRSRLSFMPGVSGAGSLIRKVRRHSRAQSHHMKTILRLAAIIAVSFAVSARAQTSLKGRTLDSDFDDTSRFIFYSVLEGLYEDGLSNKDVEQILMKKEKQSYFHFIRACPICTATIRALEAYRVRPEYLYTSKPSVSTFGP